LPRVTEQMLKNMFIGSPPSNYDRLLDFSEALGPNAELFMWKKKLAAQRTRLLRAGAEKGGGGVMPRAVPGNMLVGLHRAEGIQQLTDEHRQSSGYRHE
jgi:hypothetical protein